MVDRRKYILSRSINVNKLIVTEVVIDSHVDKHGDHISDELVIELVNLLDDKEYDPTSFNNGYSYFVSILDYKDKKYRLVWLQQDEYFYIGVLTAFKDRGA
jgi:hypothetical protein